MLRKKYLNELTYEDRINEAITQIPVYNTEWTNYNPSDPGITILENLSLLNTVQQNHIAEMPPEVKKALLKMMGFQQIKGRPARVLLYAQNIGNSLKIKKGQGFTVSNLNFETVRDTNLNGYSIRRAYNRVEGNINDLGNILNRNIPIPAYPFGENPVKGNELYFICDGLPEPGEEAVFYFDVDENKTRTPFDGQSQDMFCTIKWQAYTEKGFVDVHYKDTTGGFVFNGDFRFRMPESPAAIYAEEGYKGYCFRAVLDRAEYDMPPKLVNVFDFLLEVWQMNTKSFSKTSQRPSSITINKGVTAENYVSVFVREEKGGSYYQYFPSRGEGEGRFFDILEDDEEVEYRFDIDRYGYGPDKCRNCIRILGYNEEIMQNYKIGTIYGNDDQILELPFKRIVPDSFFVVARREQGGERIYDFVRPNHREPGELYYCLDENKGIIIIRDPGNYIGATLLMGASAVYDGPDGNVRPFNKFYPKGLNTNIEFFNPAQGQGGRFQETLESTRKRFVEDIDTPFAAVTEADYEKLVLNIPGLCIRKVKAYMEPLQNRVTVAVMPDILDKEGNPFLTEDYKEKILNVLENRKLLTTRVSVEKPVFVPVNVNATVYVKKHFDNTESMIEEAVKHALNFIDSDDNFGTAASFHRVFKEIESVKCVEFIQKLSLRPGRGNVAVMDNEDVIPNRNGIIVPGKINIETIVYYEKAMVSEKK